MNECLRRKLFPSTFSPATYSPATCSPATYLFNDWRTMAPILLPIGCVLGFVLCFVFLVLYSLNRMCIYSLLFARLRLNSNVDVYTRRCTLVWFFLDKTKKRRGSYRKRLKKLENCTLSLNQNMHMYISSVIQKSISWTKTKLGPVMINNSYCTTPIVFQLIRRIHACVREYFWV